MRDDWKSFDACVVELLDRDDLRGAIDVVYRTLGPQLAAYVAAMVRDTDVADDVLGDLYLRLSEGIGKFERLGSFRGWAYRIARNLALDYLRGPRHRRERRFATSEQSRLVQEVREGTRPYLKTAARDALSRVRAGLDPDEQTLLILRLDRHLPWEEISEVLSEPGMSVAPAALRQRFARLKEKVRQLLVREGVIA